MKAYKISSLCSLIVLCLCLTACSKQHVPKDIADVDELPQIYPDYIDVTIPAAIAPLNFAMLNDSVTTIDVEVKGDNGTSLHSNGSCTDFDIEAWHQLTTQNKGRELTVSVCAERDGRWTRYRDFSISVSSDSLGEWGVTYRRLAPGYEFFWKMGLYQRDLSTFEETPLIENTNNTGMCLNCHTANSTNPDEYTFHIRGDHGATAIHRKGSTEMLKAKNEQLGGAMVYPCWHPGGRYIAYSTNKTSQMFHTASNKRIEVYDSSSDVFVYDTETHTLLNDTLIMRIYWAENCPAFSPDGKWIYFITARRQLYPVDYDKERYSLCRVSFDVSTGKLGNKVDTLINTASTGKSVTWPRPSYDGHYLMYTQVDFGYFSIWHPEADLWLLDLRDGTQRPMNELNTSRSESLHQWSLNNRWVLFTSRRDDGLYSRLYFAHIDENGHAGKPFQLPQRDPKNFYRQLLHSYNTPDFTLKPVATDLTSLMKLVESSERTETKTVKGN